MLLLWCDSKVQSYPAGLCLNCRRNLFQCAKNKKDKVDWDWIGRAHPKLLWDNFELSTERYDPCTHSDVTCTLCQVARYNPIGRKKVSKFAKPKLGAKGEPIVQPKTRVSPKKICSKCMAETGPGLPHSQSQCTSKSAKKNIVEMIAKESVRGQEQILSASLKNNVNEKGRDPGEELRLTGLQGGNPLSVTVGKPKKVEDKFISTEFMASLQKKLNCSQRKLLLLAREFKKRRGEV